MLLKIFVPLAIVLWLVLLPVNAVGGRGGDFGTQDPYKNSGWQPVIGFDQYAWGNVLPTNLDRYWAHLFMAIIVVAYCCYVFLDELRGYIRLRQAYLTSPQHRLRASATTVLVSGIPRKWCTAEALDGLYDVFPGGIRNIWINRNFDVLNDKVKLRRKIALKLEDGLTDLIKNAKKARMAELAQAAKQSGHRKTKRERANEEKQGDFKAAAMAEQAGTSITTRGLDLSLDNQSAPERLNDADFRLSLDDQGAPERLESRSDDANFRLPAADDDSLHGNDPKFGENGPQTDSARPGSSDSRKLNTVLLHGRTKYAFWRQAKNAIDIPDPFPHGYRPGQPEKTFETHRKQWWEFWKSDGPVDEQYPDAYDKKYDPNEGDAVWKEYVKLSDRPTMRLPIFGQQWLWWLRFVFVGKKVDTIDYCRKELARLNLEIEHDQKEPEKYPLMNSAFIQFNHQVAAHMACQVPSHHIPMQMAPRAVEISPDDVFWNNMSIRWWEKWIRTDLVLVLVSAVIILWSLPVAFTGALNNVSQLSQIGWLRWLNALPREAISIIQGILPGLLLALLLALARLILVFLARRQGVATGTMAQLAVSWYYFVFLFVLVFLVVTISASIASVFSNGNLNHTEDFDISFIPNLLATNIPNASNYFFSYLLLQALSTSAGVLVQVNELLGWFVLGPIFDNTAREKWQRQVNLPSITWGTFFPVYANFACIGLIYSTIAPLMLGFLIITFGLFWFVYRYQTLYITRFKYDTGGLLFPQAINQLFIGLYVMELCLIGLFSITSSVDLQTGIPVHDPRTAQAVIMGFVFFFTIVFQVLLNRRLGPLFQYLPITLEDDAVIRDEEFARAQDKRLHLAEDEREGDNIADVLEERERRSDEENRSPEESLEMQDLPQRSKSRRLNPLHLAAVVPDAVSRFVPGIESRATKRRAGTTEQENWVFSRRTARALDVNAASDDLIRKYRLRNAAAFRKDPAPHHDPNAIITEALYAGINDEIEDLSPEERDLLIQRAFQHEALRARRPVVWIPRDDLGVSDDEIRRVKRLAGDNVWISNEHTGLDGKGRVVYRKSPPDFSELDLIVL